MEAHQVEGDVFPGEHHSEENSFVCDFRGSENWKSTYLSIEILTLWRLLGTHFQVTVNMSLSPTIYPDCI